MTEKSDTSPHSQQKSKAILLKKQPSSSKSLVGSRNSQVPSLPGVMKKQTSFNMQSIQSTEKSKQELEPRLQHKVSAQQIPHASRLEEQEKLRRRRKRIQKLQQSQTIEADQMNAFNYFFGRNSPGDASNIDMISPTLLTRKSEHRSSVYMGNNNEHSNLLDITDHQKLESPFMRSQTIFRKTIQPKITGFLNDLTLERKQSSNLNPEESKTGGKNIELSTISQERGTELNSGTKSREHSSKKKSQSSKADQDQSFDSDSTVEKPEEKQSSIQKLDQTSQGQEMAGAKIEAQAQSDRETTKNKSNQVSGRNSSFRASNQVSVERLKAEKNSQTATSVKSLCENLDQK